MDEQRKYAILFAATILARKEIQQSGKQFIREKGPRESEGSLRIPAS